MEYITAAFHMADMIYDVLHTTIKTIYPYYYPAEVADFFCRHHSKEHILEGTASGHVLKLEKIQCGEWVHQRAD